MAQRPRKKRRANSVEFSPPIIRLNVERRKVERIKRWVRRVSPVLMKIGVSNPEVIQKLSVATARVYTFYQKYEGALVRRRDHIEAMQARGESELLVAKKKRELESTKKVRKALYEKTPHEFEELLGGSAKAIWMIVRNDIFSRPK